MSNTVFILGAGASKKAGAPLMAEFLDTAHDLWKLNPESKGNEPFKTVFEGISALQSVHSKSNLDIHNVESVFAAFEMARTINALPGYSVEKIDDLLAAMRQVIVKTIESTLKFPGREGSSFPAAPEPYDAFASLIRFLTSKCEPRQKTAVLTFNYDMAIDYACLFRELKVDYALGESKSESAIPLLKLHGSFNWGIGEKKKQIVPWPLDEYFKRYRWSHVESGKKMMLGMSSHLHEMDHCGEKVGKEPLIVPPTWNKTEHHQAIAPVWARAAKELAEAENIFVIGYSLPPSDEFFRYLFALGTVGDTLLKRVWVFNPDDSGAVKSRFKKLLGPGAEARFEYFPNEFTTAISLIRKEFADSK